MAIYSRPSVQNFDDWLFWIKKNKHIALFDKGAKIYLSAKDLSKPKYEVLIKKRENTGTKHLNDSKVFTEFSNTVDEVFQNINDYNPNRKPKNNCI